MFPNMSIEVGSSQTLSTHSHDPTTHHRPINAGSPEGVPAFTPGGCRMDPGTMGPGQIRNQPIRGNKKNENK